MCDRSLQRRLGILSGVILSVLLVPLIPQAGVGPAGSAMVHVMVAGIGWAVSARPARWITSFLKKAILGPGR